MTSWRLFFREMGEAYPWADPITVGNMTIQQIRVFAKDRRALGGVQRMSLEEARAAGLMEE